MSNLDELSLFSLEVVVESLKLLQPPVHLAVSKDAPAADFHHPATGCCRFPAVAFRFLDFPTLLVNHLDAELAQTIRAKINADPYYKVPLQLPELQDKNGNFVLRKGKSCLFKTSVHTLLHHLSHTPLYVLVTDTYPAVPKLVGNCTLRLDETMHLIYDDIKKYGLSIPSTHGDKATYNIHNLMGSVVGSITMGYRLLSLGPGLLSHMPEAAIAKPIADIEVAAPPTIDSVQDAARTTSNAKLKLRKPKAKARSVAKVDQDADIIQAINRSTQTLKKQKSRADVISGLTTSHKSDGDFFIANTLCPPPLFYNREADERPTSRQDFLPSSSQNALHSLENLSPDDTVSEDGTIRPEDISIGDGVIARTKDDWDAEFIEHMLKNRELRKIPLDSAKATSASAAVPRQVATLKSAVAQFPVLSALLSELLCLDPNAKQENVKRSLARLGQQSKPVVGVTEQKENRQEFLRRLSKPRTTEADKESILKRKPQSAASNPTRKTSLVSGMTNTQRLRLAKINPDLLAKLDEQEQVRVQKWRTQHAKKWTRSGTIEVKQETGDEVQVRLDEGDVQEDEEAPEGRPDAKPVPTPRKSLGRTQPESVVTAVGADDNRTASDDDDDSHVQRSTSVSVDVSVLDSSSARRDEGAEKTASDASSSTDEEKRRRRRSPLLSLKNVQSLVAAGEEREGGVARGYGCADADGELEPGIAYDFSRVNKLSVTGERLRHSADISETFEPQLQKFVDRFDDEESSGADEEGEEEGSVPLSELSERSERSELAPVSWTTDTRSAATPRSLRPSKESPVNVSGLVARRMLAKNMPLSSSLRLAIEKKPAATEDGRPPSSPAAEYNDSTDDGRPLSSPEYSVSTEDGRPPSSPEYSVSTEDGRQPSPLAAAAEYTDSFEESGGRTLSSATDDIPHLGTISDVKLASQARFGYTWAHPT